MINNIELIGYIAGLLGLIAWIPQFQTVWFKRLHQGLDLRTYSVVLAALCVWCVYGYLKQAWAVCISNMISGTMLISIICRVRHLRREAHNTCQDITTVDEPITSPHHWKHSPAHDPLPETPETQDKPADKLLEPKFPYGPRVPRTRKDR